LRAKAIIILGSLFLAAVTSADEKGLIETAEFYLAEKNYYGSITEAMRYQYLYPSGANYSRSVLIMGKASLHGENYQAAHDFFTQCYSRYPGTAAAEESLYLSGYVSLTRGSPYFALRTFQKYEYIYPDGMFLEKTRLGKCYSLALGDRALESLQEVRKFRAGRQVSALDKDAGEFEKMVLDEINRPRKSMALAVLGSAVVPGFGHFYTGNIGTGLLSFFSNSLLIYLIYDGIRSDNRFQWVFFSLVELSFYQYSLYGAMRDVYEYNSGEKFYQSLRVKIDASF